MGQCNSKGPLEGKLLTRPTESGTWCGACLPDCSDPVLYGLIGHFVREMRDRGVKRAFCHVIVDVVEAVGGINSRPSATLAKDITLPPEQVLERVLIGSQSLRACTTAQMHRNQGDWSTDFIISFSQLASTEW